MTYKLKPFVNIMELHKYPIYTLFSFDKIKLKQLNFKSFRKLKGQLSSIDSRTPKLSFT